MVSVTLPTGEKSNLPLKNHTGFIEFRLRNIGDILHRLQYRSLKCAAFFELMANEPSTTLSPEIGANFPG
jgi:hypothetical protein